MGPDRTFSTASFSSCPIIGLPKEMGFDSFMTTGGRARGQVSFEIWTHQ